MTQHPWWQSAVIYQIYPRSFLDSNGDGVGDIPGIINRLDYLIDLGIDAVWLSPIYASPNVDGGYDIADYYRIATEFGTMADFDRLLAEMHRRGLKLIMDMVLNHTSDEHPWFREARASRDNPKRDWYHWHPGHDGRVPNNWASDFGGSAWTYDAQTEEYYLHLFHRTQPDLNWNNPAMRQAIYAMMRWWLDKRVDGFRLDVINFLMKAPGYPDALIPSGRPEAQYVAGGEMYIDQPTIHPLLQEMHREVFRHYDMLTVGECHRISPASALPYIAHDRQELDMVFQFDIKWLFAHRQTPEAFAVMDEWYRTCRDKAWNTITLSNHDSPRQVSSIGDDQCYRFASATALATLLLTAPGTPFLYQGEEFGMTNASFAAIDAYRDIQTLTQYQCLLAEGVPPAEALSRLLPTSRDHGRTPMQWSDAPQAGFTSGAPWLDVNPNYQAINLQHDQQDAQSIWQYYRSLIRLRKQCAPLHHGEFMLLSTSAPVYAYRRYDDADAFLVILNWSSTEQTLDLSLLREHTLVSGNYPATATAHTLHPWEARLYRRERHLCRKDNRLLGRPKTSSSSALPDSTEDDIATQYTTGTFISPPNRQW